jgi:hypothetical protein
MLEAVLDDIQAIRRWRDTRPRIARCLIESSVRLGRHR